MPGRQIAGSHQFHQFTWLQCPAVFPAHLENGPLTALAKITAMNIVITTFSVTSLVCAGFGTLILVRASRQATLRQVHAGLVEIAAQIKELRGTK